MKKILIAAVVSTAFISSSAFAANTDSQDLVVNATVQDECSIANPADVTFATVNINEGAGATALLLKNGSQANSQNIYVSCNYGAKLTAASANGGLVNAAGAVLAANDPDDFTNIIEYRVTLNPTDSSFPKLFLRTASANTTSVTAAGAFHNNAALEIRIDRDDTAKRPVAGLYTDTATLTVGPV